MSVFLIICALLYLCAVLLVYVEGRCWIGPVWEQLLNIGCCLIWPVFGLWALVCIMREAAADAKVRA